MVLWDELCRHGFLEGMGGGGTTAPPGGPAAVWLIYKVLVFSEL